MGADEFFVHSLFRYNRAEEKKVLGTFLETFLFRVAPKPLQKRFPEGIVLVKIIGPPAG